ncbi:hypothetical protein GCM10029978_045130 [Actinoallomurus acanthiterrae]
MDEKHRSRTAQSHRDGDGHQNGSEDEQCDKGDQPVDGVFHAKCRWSTQGTFLGLHFRQAQMCPDILNEADIIDEVDALVDRRVLA